MPPIRMNRRKFLGASAAAGWAISQGRVEGSDAARTVRVGLIGLGTRGTTLLRTLLELAGVEVVALADLDDRHLSRASGIVEKARGARPEATNRWESLADRADVDALVVALPCDLHAPVYVAALAAGKHLYGEKPLAPTLEECDRVIAQAAKSPELVAHVGYQRRSNPRYREGVILARRGDLGRLISGSGEWISSNGPMNGHDGWLARRGRSGDWMIEQAVHAWDVFGWIKGCSPARAFGHGRRDLFGRPAARPRRHRRLRGATGMARRLPRRLRHSWVAPADDAFTGVAQRVVGEAGGLDLATGSVTYRDRSRPRQTIHPGPQPDTRLALDHFLGAIRSEKPIPPPITLVEARDATAVGLLVRKAVDERRVVTWDEVVSGA